ncbi:MAG TPA: STAS domain-containing protein [Candidatus Eremiobacteraceae bacterium]|nr:STAS domain-containing protein [Candidatus Eremiobacteraceae bacterium]
MAMISGSLNIDAQRVVPALREAAEKLGETDGEAVLDFSSVARIDCTVLQALEEFAAAADVKGVKVVLCGVNVGVYKVLKLTKLASRLFFTN